MYITNLYYFVVILRVLIKMIIIININKYAKFDFLVGGGDKQLLLELLWMNQTIFGKYTNAHANIKTSYF